MEKKNKKNSFEQNLLRLEEISEKLERQDAGIEEAIKLYEEGIELSKSCMSILKNAELKISELKKKLDDETGEEIIHQEETPEF